MRILNFLTIAALTSMLLIAPAFAKKPIPPPASDLECDGCVGTTDIADGAVTLNELGSDVTSTFVSTPVGTADIGDGVITINKLGSDVVDEFTQTYKPPMVYDANGVIIGQFIAQIGSDISVLMSSTGYVFGLTARGGKLNLQGRYVYYDNDTCTDVPISVNGQPFFVPLSGGVSAVRGEVFFADNEELNSELYYIPKDGIVTYIDSYRHNGSVNPPTCVYASVLGYAITPNDPNITGVEFSSFPEPGTIGLP